MANKTKIEWTDETANPLYVRNLTNGKRGWFCEKISPGCAHCYAETMNRWRGNGVRYAADQRANVIPCLDEKLLQKIAHYRKPQKIFVGDMTDIFLPRYPEEWLDQIMAAFANLDRRFSIQFLTKRADRMLSYFSTPDRMQRIAYAGEAMGLKLRTDQWPLPHFWLGVSVEDQKTADERVPLLLQTPSVVRFVSYEPALGPVDFTSYLFGDYTDIAGKTGRDWTEVLSWVIAGGESGPKARPSHPDWFRAVRDQCQAAVIPFFFKQWGQFVPVTVDDRFGKATAGDVMVLLTKQRNSPTMRNTSRMFGSCWSMQRMSKKLAGRLLDGREWNEFPKERS